MQRGATGKEPGITSIFIFISGATLLVYSAERLIGYLVGASRHLKVSVFLLAIIFTGIEFDDIVLGVALSLEGLEGVALGLVLGTAVSFSGIVLALGAILTPTRFNIPRDYIIIFAAAPLIMVVFALTKSVTAAGAVVLILLFVVWVAYVAARESKRETPTFRDLEVYEELTEPGPYEAAGGGTATMVRQDERVATGTDREPEGEDREEAVAAMSPFSASRLPGWANLGLAVVALAGIVIGAATMSEGTEEIIERYGIEGTVFGATFVTAVLALEDLFLTVQPIRKGVPEIGIGNVIGSLIFTVTGKLGIIVLAGGSIVVGSSVLKWHLPALVVITAVAAWFLHTGQLKRWHGYVLLGLYIAYWVISFTVYGGAPVEAD
jgi:cation:H+ antiporter